MDREKVERLHRKIDAHLRGDIFGGQGVFDEHKLLLASMRSVLTDILAEFARRDEQNEDGSRTTTLWAL